MESASRYEYKACFRLSVSMLRRANTSTGLFILVLVVEYHISLGLDSAWYHANLGKTEHPRAYVDAGSPTLQVFVLM